jgi:predicted dehydrogenase
MIHHFSKDRKRVRYAVVGLGWIAQEAVLPAFKNATRNSELTALVTGSPVKAKVVGEKYGVKRVVSYDQYPELLVSGDIDAVYVALPNSMHCDFTVAAAAAKIHVLCEKPMAASVAQCEEMISACKEHRVKLMIAYRLHFEPANLKAVEILKSGKIGDPRIFHSVFSQQVTVNNVRLKKSLAGGPLMDMGVYCINAARYLFRAEPEEVVAIGGNSSSPRFREVHEMASAVLRFPNDRLASFTCSFGAAAIDFYAVCGTEGELRLMPAYTYYDAITHFLTNGDKVHKESFPKRDQFGAELIYFSECVLGDWGFRRSSREAERRSGMNPNTIGA